MGAVGSRDSDVAMSPRKAFSLAMRGGLNDVCAPAWWMNASGAIAVIFSGLEDLDLLKKVPIVSFLRMIYVLEERPRNCELWRRGAGQEGIEQSTYIFLFPISSWNLNIDPQMVDLRGYRQFEPKVCLLTSGDTDLEIFSLFVQQYSTPAPL